MYLYAREIGCNFRGPKLSPTEFRRVNASRTSRLLVFDPLGPEGSGLAGPLILVPTEDVSVGKGQRAQYDENTGKDRHQGERESRVPLLQQLLHSGRAVTDYVVSAGGPMLYDDGGSWGDVWQLLDRCGGLLPFEHPPTFARQPAGYHTTVHQLHERLLEEVAASELTGGPQDHEDPDEA
jgi:hypothetical protein